MIRMNKKSMTSEIKSIIIMVIIIAVVLGIFITFIIPSLGKAVMAWISGLGRALLGIK
jgi:hypothetical protein